MRYYFDCEFLESGPNVPIYPLSLGMVAEDGRELYVVFGECPTDLASAWVRQNVLPYIDWSKSYHRWQIKEMLLRFVGDDPHPEFWAHYADYDWVVLCQVFGKMIDLPEGWPKYCNDIKQWEVQLGNPKLPDQTGLEHHALEDARWDKVIWEFLNALSRSRGQFWYG